MAKAQNEIKAAARQASAAATVTPSATDPKPEATPAEPTSTPPEQPTPTGPAQAPGAPSAPSAPQVPNRMVPSPRLDATPVYVQVVKGPIAAPCGTRQTGERFHIPRHRLQAFGPSHLVETKEVKQKEAA